MKLKSYQYKCISR